MQAIAAELGLGRTTIYRWFGSREGLIGEVLFRAAEPLIDAARARARGRGGRALLDTFDRLNRSLADAPALRQFVEQEREAALRIITSGGGIVQPHMVARIARLIEDEVRAGTYDRPSSRRRSATRSCASPRRSSSTTPPPACAATSTACATSKRRSSA